MLDIHGMWFLVLIANFLGLIFILNAILYKPVLKVFQERQETVKGSLGAAREMNRKKDEGIEDLNRSIGDARRKAKEIFEVLRNEGLQMQRDFLAQAEERAGEMLQKGREELREEAEKARKALRADVERFSEEIVRKLVQA